MLTSRSYGAAPGGLPLAWWLALGTLLLNDHVLKGSGLLPGVITGKLSDFAGVIVAPVLLSVLLRSRTPAQRTAAFALALLPFVAIKLHPAATALWEWSLGALGVPCRVVTDPTDLLALLLLPYAVRLARQAELPSGRAVRSAGLLLGSLACMATSVDGPEEVQLQPPFLINWTRLPARVAVEELPDPRCAGNDAAVPVQVRSRELTLRPTEIASLAGVPDQDAGPGFPTCGAARVTLEDGPSVEVRWDQDVAMFSQERLQPLHAPSDLDSMRHRAESDDSWAFERAVTLAGPTQDVTLVVGERLEAR